MKNARLILILVFMFVGSVVEAGRFFDTSSSDNRLIVKVVDSHGVVLDNVTFTFDGIPAEEVTFENGAYSLDIPSNAKIFTTEHFGYPSNSMDLTELDITLESKTVLITLQAVHKGKLPESITIK